MAHQGLLEIRGLILILENIILRLEMDLETKVSMDYQNIIIFLEANKCGLIMLFLKKKLSSCLIMNYRWNMLNLNNFYIMTHLD